jgi:hypothetical protein
MHLVSERFESMKAILTPIFHGTTSARNKMSIAYDIAPIPHA